MYMDGEAGQEWFDPLERHHMAGGEDRSGLNLSYVTISDGA